MVVAFKIVEANGRKHPFVEGAADHAWFDGFRSRHLRLPNHYLMHELLVQTVK